VIQLAQQMGYDVGKLRTGKPKRLLFLYRRSIGSLANNVFYSVVLHGAELACREAGVMLSLMSVAAGDDLSSQILRHEPDALLGAGYFDDESMEAIRRCELPLVLADHFVPGVRSINDDNLLGAQLAARHLLETGCRRPAAIYGPLTHHSVALRAKGFRRALYEAQILADPELEVTLDTSLAYDEAGRDAMRRLLALPDRPDGVFVYNDGTALNVIEVCLEAGLRVPEDIRIVGYDDIEAAGKNKPGLSTIRVDKEAMGYVAAMALIEGAITPDDSLLPVELVVRESSRPMPAAPVRTVAKARKARA
jgi:DNA-binding LacI/PurR family transcriptional regulator